VAFAVAEAIRHKFHSKGITFEPSEQYLHWATKQEEPSPECDEDPTHFCAMQSGISQHGICNQSDLKYRPEWLPGNPGHHNHPDDPTPSAKLIHKARKYTFVEGRSLKWNDLSGGAANLLHGILKNERCIVAVMLPIFALDDENDNWTTEFNYLHGVVSDDPLYATDLTLTGVHAVPVSGFLADRNADGGGWFIFRNCWGGGVREKNG
jgi:hypothetical protein